MRPHVVAVCVSQGGVPKRPIAQGRVGRQGIAGDAHAHDKHNRPERAVSLLDLETIRALASEGFPLAPGTAGENLTVEGLGVQWLEPATLLEIGDVVLRLEEPRKPCYVLDAIDPRLKEAMLGRCGYMASVVAGGTVVPGMEIRVRCCQRVGRARRDPLQRVGMTA